MALEEIWRRKSDEELVDALRKPQDYTPEGRLAIKREAVRRGIEIKHMGNAMSPGQGTSSSWEEEKPHPETYLQVGTFLWVFVGIWLPGFFLHRLPKPYDNPLPLLLIWLTFGAKLAMPWVEYFKKKAAWKRLVVERSPKSHGTR